MKKGRVFYGGSGAAKMQRAEKEQGNANTIIVNDAELSALQAKIAEEQAEAVVSDEQKNLHHKAPSPLKRAAA